MNMLFKILVFAAVIPFFFPCNRQEIEWKRFEQSVTYHMLKPGDMMDDMILTTGAEDAIPLWAFCPPVKENDHLITVDCGEMSYARLAIGHTFGIMGLIPQPVVWEELVWQLSVNERPIDLKAFGINDFIHPDLALRPSPVREVFRSMRVWDVVLENPAPGAHVLEGRAQSKDQIYTWIVNFTVATTDK